MKVQVPHINSMCGIPEDFSVGQGCSLGFCFKPLLVLCSHK